MARRRDKKGGTYSEPSYNAEKEAEFYSRVGCGRRPIDIRSAFATPARQDRSDVRFAPESDRLLLCREMTLWADFVAEVR